MSRHLVYSELGAELKTHFRLLARDRGQVHPCFRYLAEPMLDHRSVESGHPHVGHVGWTRDHNRFSWASILSEADEPIPPYASPALADDLFGLPPAFIHVGAIDLFLEESLGHARRLTRGGMSVGLHVRPGAFQAIDSHVARALHGNGEG